ncbi:MAG: AAA family ATPase, partial [Polyangia bacterium]
GAVAELRREKKRGLRGKLSPADGGDAVALSDELLRARLGRPSEAMFSTVFAFSLEDLARGGEALRDEGLRAAIAGAGLGAARSPQAVIKELRDKAEALFTVKGRAGKLINSTLAEIKGQQEEKRKVEARGEDYQARVQARDLARGEAESLGRTRGELLARIGEREALVRALPRRDELRGALAERASLPPSTLPPDAGDDYRRALEERARLSQRAGELDAKLARAQREAEALTVDDALLGAAPRIRPLAEGLGRHAEESRQADELGGALRTRRIELSRQLADLKAGWSLDDLDVLPHPLFTSGLERLREGWSGQQQRAIELGRLETARRELESRRATLRRRLDPPWPLDDERAFLPVPRAEECKRHRDALGTHERAIAELKRDGERLLEEQRALESQLSRLDAGGVVPSTEELSRLRAARDAHWSALRRSLGAARTTAAERATLADAFESALRAADTHADELRRRSDDVAKRAELELRLAEVTRARADRAAALATAERERADADTTWRALWSRCGF